MKLSEQDIARLVLSFGGHPVETPVSRASSASRPVLIFWLCEGQLFIAFKPSQLRWLPVQSFS